MKEDTKTTIKIGKLSKDIKNLMTDKREKEAYNKLGELNSLLSDLNGKVLQLEEVLSLNN